MRRSPIGVMSKDMLAHSRRPLNVGFGQERLDFGPDEKRGPVELDERLARQASHQRFSFRVLRRSVERKAFDVNCRARLRNAPEFVGRASGPTPKRMPEIGSVTESQGKCDVFDREVRIAMTLDCPLHSEFAHELTIGRILFPQLASQRSSLCSAP